MQAGFTYPGEPAGTKPAIFYFHKQSEKIREGKMGNRKEEN